jgi:hypothetical protein
MPAAAIPFGTRYTSRGTTRIYFLTAIASYTTAVTRLELNAGVDLTAQIMDSSGWTVSADQIDAPDMATRFTSKIPGAISADDSSLTMYASKNGVDARATFSSGSSTVPATSGYVVILFGGDIAANKMDVWPVTVSSVAKQISVQGSDPDTLVISFSPTGEPAQNLAIPA